jgi:hypothetical protein
MIEDSKPCAILLAPKTHRFEVFFKRAYGEFCKYHSPDMPNCQKADWDKMTSVT